MSKPDTPARRAAVTVLRYGLAVLSVAVALIITFLLRPDALVTPIFFLAIILSAWLGGIGSGLLASLLAALAIDYFFLQPLYALSFDLAELPHLLVFFLSAVLVSSWSVARKRAETLLQQARDEQEAKVQERTADLKQSNEKLQAEIAERGRMEATLRERADLLDLTHDTVFVRDLSDVITYWNRGAEELYAWGKEEAVGQVSHDLLLTIFPAPPEEIGRELSSTDRWEGELVHARRDGTQVVVASRWALQRDESGRPVAILETNNDITERKRAEEALREKASLLDLTHDTVFARGMDDVITYWNHGAQQMYGWTSEEAVGQVSHRLTQTIFPAPLEDINKRLLDTGRWEGELIHAKRDGSRVVVASRWSLQHDDQGDPIAILETNNDVTERRQAEEALRESERRYRSIFQGAGVSIWEEDFSQVKAAIDELKAQGVRDFRQYTAVHPDFVRQAIPMVKVIDVNDAAVKLFAAESKDELLVSLDKIFLPETEEVFMGELVAIAEGRTSFESETILQTLKGDKLIALLAIAFPPPPARLDSVLVSIMDITERKRAQEALQKAQAELAHVTRVTMMGELATSIAHEVNQPLAAVVTNGNACQRWLAGAPPNLDEARECLRRIIRDGNRASEVIARIRALVKKSSPAKTRLDLSEAIQEVLLTTNTEARRHRVLVRTELAAGLPAVRGDRVQLQQVILNLVMNGIESMKAVAERPRELVIESRLHESGQVLVAVRDSGVGLEPQSLERVFEAFYTTKTEGMGMGLSISRSIIEAHGGRLWATANHDHGATFQFALPTNNGDQHD